MDSEGQYDAIIIGAGLGGLTVGNMLSYNGYKVLIIDKNHVPGGCVVNFQRKDFRFDSAIHFINGCGKGGMVYRVLETFGAQNEIEWLPITNLIHWVDAYHKFEAHPPVPLKEYIEFLSKNFPKEAPNVRRFFKDFANIIESLFGLLDPKWSVKMATLKKSRSTMMHIMPQMTATVDKVIRKYFKDPALIELLTLFVAPFGNTSDKESFFYWYMSEISYHAEGAWYPKGGAGEFTASLARYFEKIGGTLLLNHEVKEIIIQKKLTEGVICKDKKGIEHKFTSAIVVHAADLTKLVMDLVPPNTFSQKWVDKTNNHATQHSLVIVFLGLNIDVKDYGISDYELWQLNYEWRTPENYKHIFEDMDYSQLPMEVVTFYSNGPDKTCCPPGKTVLSILTPTHLEPWLNLLEDGKKGKKYLDFKKKCGDDFIKRLATLLKIPDLAKHVEVIEIATPITLYRYNYAKNGTPIGYSFNVDSVMQTQLFGTKIKNLTLAGQFTFPGGGMSSSMLGGLLAARAAMKRLKKFKTP